jgi:flagellar hook-basal body complex protein FliE
LCDYWKSPSATGWVFAGDWHPAIHPGRLNMSNISAVDGLLAQMRVAAAAAGLRQPEPAAQPGKVDFTSVLKNALDGVAQSHEKSEALQQAFVRGDPNVSLSDTMIAMQKAGINLQTTIQVRNKVVQAYNDIMNMQI